MKKCWSSPQIFSHRIWKGTRAFWFTDACIQIHSWQSHARHSPARHGDLNFSGGDHCRERLEIRETRHIQQPAHHCGHDAGWVLRKDTASILHSVDLEWVRVGACVRESHRFTRDVTGAQSVHARENSCQSRAPVSAEMPASTMREPSAQIQSSREYILL